MSDDFAWDDTPGSQLPSRRESIDFTAVRRVKEIRAVYDEEYAFRTNDEDEGSFQAGFETSTISEDGKTVSLKRRGGWNRRFRVYPEIEPAAVTSGVELGAIYEVDLTGLPSQTMASAGSYTIDGKVWWAKGPLAGGSAACALVDGSGLRLFKDADDANLGWHGQNATFNDRLLALRIDQLADYNPLAPLAIEWRFTSTHALTGTGNRTPFAGVSNIVESSAAYTAGEKATCTALAITDASVALWDPDPRANGANTISASSPSTVYGDYVQGIYRFASRKYYPLIGAWSGSLGKPDDYQAFNAANVITFSGQSIDDAAPAFFFCLDKPFGGQLDIYLTHLRILQPRVP